MCGSISWIENTAANILSLQTAEQQSGEWLSEWKVDSV